MTLIIYVDEIFMDDMFVSSPELARSTWMDDFT
jgi:hypothetical protein